MSSSREIRVGKISGLSSYELAVKNGTFTGTLTEYLRKEQKYYDDMVLYGTNLKNTIATMVQPESEFQTYVAAAASADTDQETTIFNLKYTKKLFLNISAYVKFTADTPINDGVMTIYINNNPMMRATIVNNIVTISTPYIVEPNDEIKITVLQTSGFNRFIAESAINTITTERS